MIPAHGSAITSSHRNQNIKHLTNFKTADSHSSLPTILIAVIGQYNYNLILLNLAVELQGFGESVLFKVTHYQDTNHYSKLPACSAVHLNYRDIQCPRLPMCLPGTLWFNCDTSRGLRYPLTLMRVLYCIHNVHWAVENVCHKVWLIETE